jgi:hypothetical protein
VHHSDAGSLPGLNRSSQRRFIGERTVAVNPEYQDREGCRVAVVAEDRPEGEP